MDFVRTSRTALAEAGFVRSEADGTVWWSAGTGEPIVLVHGVNDQAGTWYPIAPALLSRGKVVIPDLPGHGESQPRRVGPIPFQLLVEGLSAVVEQEAESGRVIVVGNSLGGWVSLLWALANPHRVRHLVLETSGGLARSFGTTIAPRTREEAAAVLRAVHGPGFSPEDWQLDLLLDRTIGSPAVRVTGMSDYFVDSRLHEITFPVTLIWGEEDGVLPLAYGRELQAGIAGAKLEVISGAAHIPHLQKPAEVLGCLTAIF